MRLNNQRILVTGATGFIGKHLVQELIRRNLDVTVLLRDQSQLSTYKNAVQIITADIRDDMNLPLFDVVFHLAALTKIPEAIKDPKTTIEVNTIGTLNLLEHIKKTVKKFIYVSTLGVYGRPVSVPVKEDDLAVPLEPYAASKLAAETIVLSYKKAYGMNAVIGRVFNCYGEGQADHFVISQIIQQLLEKDTIELGNTAPIRDFIYVKDVVDALIVLAEKGEDDIYNIGTGKGNSIAQVANTLINISGEKINIVSNPQLKKSQTIEIPQSIADITKIKKLGWTPKNLLTDGLKKTYEYYHDNQQ